MVGAELVSSGSGFARKINGPDDWITTWEINERGEVVCIMTIDQVTQWISVWEMIASGRTPNLLAIRLIKASHDDFIRIRN